jgi:hypothetical protein
LDTFTVVLSDSVDFSHDPVPSNESEQLLFPQHFETLVRLDCRGQLRPGLAKAWTADETGRVWTFVLPDAVFIDGSPASAPRVVSSWRARDAAVRELGIESVAVLHSNRLVVRLNQLADSAPRLFANPGLAVSRAPSRLAPDTDILVVQSDRPPPAVIHFRVEPNSDPRDALDRGADLVVTRDPALVDYVSNRAEFATFPLPWSRTYVLLEAGGRQGELAGDLNATSVRSSLAKDAVRAGARAAEPPYWWSDETACRASSAPHSGSASSRSVYRKEDEESRGLAERIVALASSGAGLRAVGLEGAELATAIRDGTERAYVVGLPRRSLAPCRDASIWPAGARLLPLIDTRAYAIVRKGSPPLSVEWDGTIRVVEP